MFEQEVLQIIKQAAAEAVQAGRPADLAVGTVTSAKPLKIKLMDGLELGEAFLRLSRNATDYETDVTVTEKDAWSTEEASDHTHALLLSKKRIKIHNALKKGETVLLMRRSGGQEYAVLDRMVKP